MEKVNMVKTLITGRRDFVDIDTLACAIAYKELCLLKGENVDSLLPQETNPSITEEILKWNMKYYKDVKVICKETSFILVDCSEKTELESFIIPDKITMIFDHYGEPESWHNYPKIQLKIEDVGACATLIWEEFIKASLQRRISNVSANLLYTAIASQTLNFFSSVTTDRDIKAYNELKQYISLSPNWIMKYFKDVDSTRISDLKNALIRDTKIQSINNNTCTITQLELWDSEKIILQNIELIDEVLSSFETRYAFLTSPSLKFGINFFVTSDPELQLILNKSIGAEFHGNIGKTSKLWLRKEMLKLFKKL